MPFKDKEKAKEYKKEYYQGHKEEMDKKVKQWQKNNPEKMKQNRIKYRKNNPDYNKKYYRDNYEKVKEYRKRYHLENRTEVLKRQKEWYGKNKERERRKNKKYYIDHPEYIKQYRSRIKSRYIYYKASAKNKGFIFDLTLADFSEIVNEPCYYCGGNGYGVDRLDSLIGYLEGNIVSCCSMCNYMKRTYTEEDFINQCIKIADNKERG